MMTLPTARLNRRLTAVFLLIVLVVGALSAAAQEDGGHGVVRLPADTQVVSSQAGQMIPSPNPGALLPRNCESHTCAALLPLLYLRLFDVDPETGALLDATQSRRALVESVPADLPADVVTLRLAERTWSDGTPITSYDVLYTLFTLGSTYHHLTLNELAGVQIVDARTLVVRYAGEDAEPTATCDDVPRTNFYVLPAHVSQANFQVGVDTVREQRGEEVSLSMDQWGRALQESGYSVNTSSTEIVTSAAYRYDTLTPEQQLRLVPEMGGPAVEVVPAAFLVDSPDPSYEAFLTGAVDVLLDVSPAQRADLRALVESDVRPFQLAATPGRGAWVIRFNMANPDRPLPPLHPETGEILDQGEHPVLGDPAVRRALRLAIDPELLIEDVFDGDARPVAGLFPPTSWVTMLTGETPRMGAVTAVREANIRAANRILDEAGWRDNDRDGVRECVECERARRDASARGTRLAFNLAQIDGLTSGVSTAWRRIGANVQMYTASWGEIGQGFDAALEVLGDGAREAADPDLTLMLTPAGDVLNPPIATESLNWGSYENPEVTRLLEQARTLPGCDRAERAAIYAEVSRIVTEEDVAFIPLLSPDEFYAAAPGVIGFAPRPGDPLWNLRDWTVAR